MTAPRALLSVYDKTGIVELAHALTELGFELVSSGGTATELQNVGIDVIEVEDVTGYPAMLDDRVKTLHPAIHGGILGDLTNPAHVEQLEEHDIQPFGLVVVNLYPFESDPSIKLIDVGGPTMVRGAAKNYQSVGIVTSPSQYDNVIAELQLYEGNLTLATRLQLAVEAFNLTSDYELAIWTWIQTVPEPEPDQL